IIFAFTILVSLGVWQLIRLNEKELFLTTIKNNLNNPPNNLKFLSGEKLYAKVKVKGEFLIGKNLHLYGHRALSTGKDGYYLIIPFKTDDNKVILVVTGWFVSGYKRNIDKSIENSFDIKEITGVILPSEKKRFFVFKNDVKNNIWFTLDLKEAAEVLDLKLEEFYLVMDNEQGKEENNLKPLQISNLLYVRNDHLEYAITWFSLAVALIVIFIIFHWRKGKFVVLYFYPRDDTPGCTMQAGSFNRLKAEFEKMQAVIIGVSKDDLDSHDKFKKKYCLEFDLASDANSDVCEKYQVWGEKSMFGKKYMGIERTTFLIDKDGKIACIWPKVQVKGHAEEIGLNMVQEKKKFDAEVGKILNLMIHSLYSNKEIFMRELISNSSDACDKLRHLSITSPKLTEDDPIFKITVKVDKEKKQIIIRDNGIGMNKEDLIDNLGTIARSGTDNFLQNLSGDAKKDNMLIGQFGVGFYSAFMIADTITVNSKKAGEEKAYSWQSDGVGEYIVGELEDSSFTRGTEVIIHVKPQEESYVDHFRIKHIVKSYSDHIAVPIYFVEETTSNEVQLNTASALWTRPKSEVSEEQYKDFYKTLSYSVDDPWLIIHNKNEGMVEFTNLLFIPSTKTFDLFHPDRKRRVKLYIKRVFISDENIDLIPSYLRFLRGVVDSEDLPLNISRESLQHNSTLEKIKATITNKVLGELKKKKDESIEEYGKFWANFGAALKEGLCEATADHDKLLETCIFRSSVQGKMISLDEYISNFKEGQDTIYYLSGDDPAKLLSSPQIEGFLSKNIDVLLFTDTVDDFWVNVNSNYKNYAIKSVTRSDIDLEKENQPAEDISEEKASGQYTKLIEYFKEILGNLVKEVRISKKLTSSPACLAVGDGAMDIRMERFLIEQKQLMAASAKILELNPKHKIIEKINNDVIAATTSKDGLNDELVKLIYDQACILEGEPVNDTGNFAKRLNDIIQKAIL
ncbi:Chaperone protein HtpG, partial [Pseudolycoriella hygida]